MHQRKLIVAGAILLFFFDFWIHSTGFGYSILLSYLVHCPMVQCRTGIAAQEDLIRNLGFLVCLTREQRMDMSVFADVF
jgi:hypothetical protein